MVVGGKAVVASVSAVGLVTLFSGIAVHYGPRSANNDILLLMENEAGAVAGRIVSISAKAYSDAFHVPISLGQCPLKKKPDGELITCSEQFTGTKVLLAKGSMTVDVSRVQSSEDVTLHVMGGFGASVGVLGLVSAKVKYNVAVTTETTKKDLNLISSYAMSRGVMTLQSPRPKSIITDSALFLSEIELGGDELFMVTLKFESEKQKVDVQMTVTFKILFITISAKLRFVHTTFKSKAKVIVQFRSSWREQKTEKFDDIASALPRVEELEKIYMNGPNELRKLENDDEKLHTFYYFSSWKQSPYGRKFNLALINHDLDFLEDQNTEMQSVLHRISVLMNKSWSSDQRSQMNKLNQTLTEKTQKLSKGIEIYHTLSPSARQGLRDLYGEDKAPLYYTRELDTIIGE